MNVDPERLRAVFGSASMLNAALIVQKCTSPDGNPCYVQVACKDPACALEWTFLFHPAEAAAPTKAALTEQQRTVRLITKHLRTTHPHLEGVRPPEPRSRNCKRKRDHSKLNVAAEPAVAAQVTTASKPKPLRVRAKPKPVRSNQPSSARLPEAQPEQAAAMIAVGVNVNHDGDEDDDSKDEEDDNISEDATIAETPRIPNQAQAEFEGPRFDLPLELKGEYEQLKWMYQDTEAQDIMLASGLHGTKRCRHQLLTSGDVMQRRTALLYRASRNATIKARPGEYLRIVASLPLPTDTCSRCAAPVQ